MSWLDHIAGEIPPPRDDEPNHLRQDIADELADHLQCALNRELHRTGDETEAKHRVLDRFGNPQHVARKLWLEWMKDKIMSQRIMLATTLVMAAACVAVGFFAWQIADQSQAANAALLARTHETGLALLERFDRLEQQSESPSAYEWGRLIVKLDPTSGNERADNFEVRLKGGLIEQGSDITLTRQADQTGAADFGFVRVGQHSLEVETPWAQMDQQITVEPGPPQEQVLPIAYPPKREDAKVRFSVDWPEAVPKERIEVRAIFGFHQPKNVDPWNYKTRSQIVRLDGASDWAVQSKEPAVVNASDGSVDIELMPHVAIPDGEYTLRHVDISLNQDDGAVRLLTSDDVRMFYRLNVFQVGRLDARRDRRDKVELFGKEEFTAHGDEINHWEISFGKEFVEVIREKYLTLEAGGKN